MSTSQLNSVGTEVSTGIHLTLWISLCFIDPSLLGFVAEIISKGAETCQPMTWHDQRKHPTGPKIRVGDPLRSRSLYCIQIEAVSGEKESIMARKDAKRLRKT